MRRVLVLPQSHREVADELTLRDQPLPLFDRVTEGIVTTALLSVHANHHAPRHTNGQRPHSLLVVTCCKRDQSVR